MWSKRARTAFRFLGIEPTMEESEIKRAYLRSAKKYHPDKNPADRKNAERLFKELQDHMLVLKRELQHSHADEDDEDDEFSDDTPFVVVDEDSWLDSLTSAFGHMGFDLNIFGIPRNEGRQPLTAYVPPATLIHGGSLNIDLPCGARLKLNVMKGTVSGESIGLRTAAARYMLSLVADLPDDAEVDDDDELVSLEVEPLLTDLLLGRPIRLPKLDGEEQRALTADEIRDGMVYMDGEGLPLLEGGRGDLQIVVRPILPDADDPEQRRLLEALHAHLKSAAAAF